MGITMSICQKSVSIIEPTRDSQLEQNIFDGFSAHLGIGLYRISKVLRKITDKSDINDVLEKRDL